VASWPEGPGVSNAKTDVPSITMGKLLKGSCACGFSTGLLFMGAGMRGGGSEFLTACSSCHTLREQGSADERICQKCGSDFFYLHEKGNFLPADVLQRFQVEEPWNLEDTEDEALFDENPTISYRCPNCGRMEMRLLDSGRWD
jgi:hypothetical protein